MNRQNATEIDKIIENYYNYNNINVSLLDFHLRSTIH